MTPARMTMRGTGFASGAPFGYVDLETGNQRNPVPSGTSPVPLCPLVVRWAAVNPISNLRDDRCILLEPLPQQQYGCLRQADGQPLILSERLNPNGTGCSVLLDCASDAAQDPHVAAVFLSPESIGEVLFDFGA